MEHGCNDSPGTFGMFTVGNDYQVQQQLPQYFATQLITSEWVQPGKEVHHVFPVRTDIDDGTGHALVTAYALERPDGQWSLLVVNRDQDNEHKVRIRFHDDASRREAAFTGEVSVTSFGRAQYLWHPAQTVFMAHPEHNYDTSIQTEKDGHAAPDGPPVASKVRGEKDTAYVLPAASITVLHGNISK